MSLVAVRLQMFSTGSMTSALGGFLEGETGELTYPVPVFLIEHPDGLVAIDAGLHPELATDSGRLGPLDGPFRVHLRSDGTGSAGAVLRTAGFDPAQVDQVVVTHLHFDHVGGLVEFPNARLVVQAAEWAARDDEAMVASGAYNPDDIDLGHDRLEIAGDHDIFGDGSVTCLLTDGHTAGHQSVRVRTEAGTFVICGDCCYLRRTLVDEHLPPFGVSRERQVVAVRRMGVEQSRGASLIYGHDPEQWEAIGKHGLAAGA
ncbi:MAG: N-acyl homoserine lactonase family protein [Acidimicrobiia bacterium]|nr:N-acyl homoserine lactonase family protein [Acidimicrobiia bacterium]MDH5237764.1 N-acyl homoserine lactonase family protein [Acidimicrobiia bacterium]